MPSSTPCTMYTLRRHILVCCEIFTLPWFELKHQLATEFGHIKMQTLDGTKLRISNQVFVMFSDRLLKLATNHDCWTFLSNPHALMQAWSGVFVCLYDLSCYFVQHFHIDGMYTACAYSDLSVPWSLAIFLRRLAEPESDRFLGCSPSRWPASSATAGVQSGGGCLRNVMDILLREHALMQCLAIFPLFPSSTSSDRLGHGTDTPMIGSHVHALIVRNVLPMSMGSSPSRLSVEMGR